MSLHSLPLFVRMAGRPVILIGDGEAATAKRRLLERAGAAIVGEAAPAALAIVAVEDADEALAAVARLKARGVLVNAVDRPDACDFTLPAIVDRSPVILAVGTGGVSAGLAAALRQRLEGMLPASLGRLAEALHGARAALRARFPDGRDRRTAIAAALAPHAPLDPLRDVAGEDVLSLIGGGDTAARVDRLVLASGDPDELTLRQARLLASADRVYYRRDLPAALLDRARADAARIVCAAPPVDPPPGLSVWMEVA